MTSALLFERNQKSAEAQELLSAVMTSAYLLEEAGISNADVSISVGKRRESQVTVEEAVSLFKKLTTANVTVKNDGNQQMVRVQQMKRDQLLCKQALKQRESWISDDDISSDVITTSSNWYLEIAIAKRCRLHKLIRQRFAFALKIQQMLFALITSSRKIPAAHPVVSYNEPAVAMNPVASFAYPVAVFEVSAVASNQRSIWKESMAEIESCKLPQFKGTRFVLFWEIVQLTEERCTYLERRQFGLDKRRKDLNLQSNGHIRTEAIYAKATPLKKVDEHTSENRSTRELVTVRLSQKICCTVHQ
ncbi:hypothetical protein F511_40988 [Dorcoceras hygrometricum]|uniref:Uncharacterized protein n=1 Tax=Dorcoceras hygrometricum TaxID=472368 RepID=A0A2Z7CYH1_9LAMI|nr:hypothetical protein F511_40988 [Dorcoceras hygrometricum]